MMKPSLNNVARAARVLLLGAPKPEKGMRGLGDKFGRLAEGLAKEAEIGPILHEEAMAALARMQEMDSSLKKKLDEALAYAVFPSTAKAALVVGVTYGKGEVFEKGQVIGYAGLIQVTGGIQLGGQTLHALVIMKDESALKQFKSGKTTFSANASLGIIKTGVTAARGPQGLRLLMYPEGGQMLEAAIGGQTIKFKPAVQGRAREAA